MASELAAAAKPLSIEAIPTVTIGGLPVAVIDRAASARIMVGHAVARRGSGKPPLYVTSANGQVLSMCAADPEMKKLFLASPLIHADGMPLVFASRWRCRRALPERVATTDLFHEAKVAVEADAAFYMLGGTPEALRKAMSNVRRLYPRLRLVGSRHGYFRPEEEETVIADINASRPDILWVALGAPLEQRFAVSNLARLTQVGVIKTSGGLFDFLSGERSRAPAWMQSAGLEWLYRLLLEPRRLLLRYAVTNPHAAYLLLTRSG